MTTHELANILLQQEDVPVMIHYDHDEIGWFQEPINDVAFYKGTAYLSQAFIIPSDENLYFLDEEAIPEPPTWGTLLSKVSIDCQEAFFHFIDDLDKTHRMKRVLEQDRLWRILWGYYASNANLTKEHIKELSRAACELGFDADPKFIEEVEKPLSWSRYNTESEQLAAINNNK
jgi:hypothetical protein